LGYFFSPFWYISFFLCKLSTEIKSLLTERDFIVEIGGFNRFMLMLNDKLKHDPIIDLDNVEESVLVKNVVKQAKKL
jgi:hypothetical protein